MFLELHQLNLDLDNPRLPLPRPTSLNGALNAMLALQRDKLFRLAEDVVERGLAPGEALYVLETKDNPNIYTVLEGNRRTAALKILDNPALDGELPFFKQGEGRALLKRFQLLRPLFDRSAIDPLFCVVTPDREAAVPWLQRRHAGEMDGIGLTGWDAPERDRARNPNSPMVTLTDFLRTEGLNDDEDRIVQRQYTTIERIIDTVSARRKLGLEVNSGVLCSLIDPDQLLGVVKGLLAKIAATPAPSRLLNKAEAIEAFVDELPLGILPDPDRFAAPVSLKALREHYRATSAEPTETPESTPPAANATPPPPAPHPRPPPRRETLFKRGEVPAFEPRARDILGELTKLKQSTHPTAVTILFRVFLERSVREYVEKHEIAVPKKGGHEKVSDFVVASFNHITAANPNLELKALERVVRAGLAPHHIDVLNRVVHDRFAFASTSDIENIADTFRDFLVALWSKMR
ncbi:MAG: hypothetical protein V4747_11555 [Pseudomonadota bacterium]